MPRPYEHHVPDYLRLDPEEDAWRDRWDTIMLEKWEVWKGRSLWRVTYMTSGWQLWESAERRIMGYDNMPLRMKKWHLNNLHKLHGLTMTR